jgi:hypothetical protein
MPIGICLCLNIFDEIWGSDGDEDVDVGLLGWMPCGLVGRYFYPDDGDYVSPKRWYLPTSPYGDTKQKTSIDIVVYKKKNVHMHSFYIDLYGLIYLSAMKCGTFVLLLLILCKNL